MGRGRQGGLDLGHLRAYARQHQKRSVLDRLAADLPRRWRRAEPAWPGLLPPPVDELLAAGIEPFATLYHWDLPQALQDKYGGWQSKETAKAFADYAGYVAAQLGDRVKHVFTINEFASFVEGGYQGLDVPVGGGKTVHLGPAPGLRLDAAGLNQVRHHAVLGHGLAVEAIRAQGAGDTKVGFAENIRVAVPVMDTPEYVRAAELVTRERNAGFMTVMLEGKYLDSYLKEAGADAPTFTDEELKTIGAPLDFVGINVYKPGWYVAPADQPPGYRIVPVNASHPKMLSSWHVLDPVVMYWAPRQMQTIWGAGPFTSPRTDAEPPT